MATFLEVLGAQVDVPIEDREKYFVTTTLPRFGEYITGRPQQYMRVDELHAIFFLLSLRHLGAPASSKNISAVEQGTDLARQYFAEPWHEVNPHDAEVMNKSKGNSKLVWFRPMRYGLLLSLLANRLDVVTLLADWMEAWMSPEPAAIPVDPLVGKSYLVLGADFRTAPLEGIADVEQGLRTSRKQGPKLLYKAWQAVRDEDQAAFEAAFHASLAHFEKTFVPTRVAYEWIAFDNSVLLAAARHRGRELPELTPRQQARVLTHESLDLPAPHTK